MRKEILLKYFSVVFRFLIERQSTTIVTVYKNRRYGFLGVVRLNLVVALNSWLISDEFFILKNFCSSKTERMAKFFHRLCLKSG